MTGCVIDDEGRLRRSSVDSVLREARQRLSHQDAVLLRSAAIIVCICAPIHPPGLSECQHDLLAFTSPVRSPPAVTKSAAVASEHFPHFPRL